MVGAAAEGDAALADGRVQGREGDVAAGLAVERAVGEGERKEGGVRVAGLGELGGLQDVFAGDELGGELVVQLEGAELGGGGLAVGGVLVVGEGDTGGSG